MVKPKLCLSPSSALAIRQKKRRVRLYVGWWRGEEWVGRVCRRAQATGGSVSLAEVCRYTVRTVEPARCDAMRQTRSAGLCCARRKICEECGVERRRLLCLRRCRILGKDLATTTQRSPGSVSPALCLVTAV